MRSLALIALFLLAAVPTALAQNSIGTSGTTNTNTTSIGTSGTNGQQGEVITLNNPLGAGTNLQKLLMAILDFVIYLGSIVIVFMLIYVGFKFVTARGNEGEIREARGMLLWTLIGALILLGAKAIALGLEATVKALSVGQ